MSRELSMSEKSARELSMIALPFLALGIAAVVMVSCERRELPQQGEAPTFTRLCSSVVFTSDRNAGDAKTEVCRDTAVPPGMLKVGTLCKDSAIDSNYQELGDRYTTMHYKHWKSCRDTVLGPVKHEPNPSPMRVGAEPEILLQDGDK